MVSARSYLDPVTRDLDTTFVRIAPDPPGPPATDTHDGVVDAFPVAHVNTKSTAHNLEQFTKPSNNPNVNNNDALVMDLASYINKHHRDEASDASSIVSSESHHLCDEEPISNSEPHQHDSFQPGGDDSMTFAISDIADAAVDLADDGSRFDSSTTPPPVSPAPKYPVTLRADNLKLLRKFGLTDAGLLYLMELPDKQTKVGGKTVSKHSEAVGAACEALR